MGLIGESAKQLGMGPAGAGPQGGTWRCHNAVERVIICIICRQLAKRELKLALQNSTMQITNYSPPAAMTSSAAVVKHRSPSPLEICHNCSITLIAFHDFRASVMLKQS